MSHITSEAMEKFYEMTKKDTVIEIDGRPYKLKGYEAALEPTVTPIETHTLQGVVDAITKGFESGLDKKIHIHVYTPTHVFLETDAFGPFLQRHILIESIAYTTQFKFGSEYATEDFIISLLSQFAQNGDRDSLLELVSSITVQTSGTVRDNGVSQSMEVKKGISMRDRVEVKNPFVLMPYRTFQEIEQPASEFVFRVHEHERSGLSCSLHEADGSKWKIEAIEGIKEFFTNALPDVTVIT